jgi:hypothetical protein
MNGDNRHKRVRNTLVLLLALAVVAVVGGRCRGRQREHAGARAVPPAEALPETFRDVVGATKLAERHQSILSLQQWLASRPKDEAVGVIGQFLASGQDAPTGQGFQLNADGSLREAPTLRTLLLDMLSKLDPVQAAAAAKGILQRKDSADEWAVALALYARANSTDDALSFLRQKAEEMANYQPWQVNPSVGFLEAFDVFVYTGDTNFVPELAQLASNKENPAAAHAAFLALDRLAQNDPLDMLGTLNDDPTLLSGREGAAAGFFARADVRDPDQKALLADYLLSPARSSSELEAFAGLYPNENFMVSNNLLTRSATLSNAELLSRYQAAQQAVGQWLHDSRFEGIWPQLQRIQGRLSRILAGAGQ